MPSPSVLRPPHLTLVDAGDGDDLPFQTVWETDHRGMNLYQSPSWYRYVGDEPGGSYGEDWLRFYHPEDRERLRQAWDNSLGSEGANVYDIEARIRRHDGEYRWFRIQGAPQRSSDGRVIKWSGTCTDIHDRKAANAPTEGEPAGMPLRKQQPFRLASWRPGLIERRLFLIALAALLPLVLLSFATLLDSAHRQKRQLIDTVQDTAGTMVTAVDTELKVTISALETLAASPRLKGKDLTDFREEARQLLARHPAWVNIVLSDGSARQLMNLRIPPGQPLPRKVDPSAVEETARSGTPIVGNVVLSPVLKTHAFAVLVPVGQGKDAPLVLSAVMLPNAVREIVERQRFPEQGLSSVVDRNLNVVARSRDHEKWVGGPVSDELVQLMKQPEGRNWAITRTLEGVPVYTVFRRSPLTGWAVAIGVPAAAVDGPINRSYGILGAAIAASVIVGLLVAALIGRTITRPMRELERSARAMGHGEAPAVPVSEFPEVRQVGAALSAAHVEREKLLERERESRLLEQHARQLAEHASKAKDEFLAMLGHELRNPLAAISMASQILDQTLPAGPNQEVANEAKAILRRQVRNLAQLTDDLLDASRVIMGKVTLDRKPADASVIVRAAIESLEKTIKLSDYQLELNLSRAWVEIDATRMEQVVGNLVTNAVKYTPPPGKIAVSLQQEGGDAVLRVRDSGMGIEADLLPHIFDLFVQGRRSLSRSQGGLGIGLTLVRRLVELHGGRVEVRSEGPGKGSEFIVRLPAIDAPEKGTISALPFPAVKRRKIVIVEDNGDVRATLRSFLELKGHQVFEAVDGQAGLDAILQHEADIALVDIGLPRVNGYDIAMAVRQRALRPVMLVAITGYGSRDDIERGKQSGFDHYLVKPVDTALLDSLISQSAPAA